MYFESKPSKVVQRHSTKELTGYDERSQYGSTHLTGEQYRRETVHRAK
jgi:hypothetical protein